MKRKKIIRRPGSGRTKGSYSFVRLPWATLKQFVGVASTVTVSRKWCENVGIVHGVCSRADNIYRSRIVH